MFCKDHSRLLMKILATKHDKGLPYHRCSKVLAIKFAFELVRLFGSFIHSFVSFINSFILSFHTICFVQKATRSKYPEGVGLEHLDKETRHKGYKLFIYSDSHSIDFLHHFKTVFYVKAYAGGKWWFTIIGLSPSFWVLYRAYVYPWTFEFESINLFWKA